MAGVLPFWALGPSPDSPLYSDIDRKGQLVVYSGHVLDSDMGLFPAQPFPFSGGNGGGWKAGCPL